MNNKQSTFSQQNKNALAINNEITENGLIWRKLSDGSGSWRYDFVMNNERFKGVIGKERDNYTLSQVRNEYEYIKAKARLSTKGMNEGRLQNQIFSEATDSYLSWSKTYHKDFKHNYQRIKNHLNPKFGNCKITAITKGDVEKYREELLQNGLSKGTIKKLISLMSGVFKHAANFDYSINNPTSNLKSFRIEPTILNIQTKEETDKLLKSTENNIKDQTIIGLALFAGLRASEILGLTWDNVHMDKKYIDVVQTVTEGKLFQTTKSGRKRSIIISASLQKILKRKSEVDGHNGFLISSDDGDSHYYAVQKLFRTICNKAETVDNFGIHSLRHTFATRAVENGVLLPALQKWMGHSDIKTTMGYVHVGDAHIYEQAKLLA